jgi:flavin reductase (DIM6/NTAB) family NADH-FMN oxidoreductase RutF
MGLDPLEFRKVMGGFATGVTIVTAVDPVSGAPVGMTVNSFNSVSLNPPLVLFSLDRRAFGLPAFEAAGHFAINMLGAEQRELSSRFARAKGDKWTNTQYREGHFGCPILLGSLGVFECRQYARHDGGDHVIFLGEVLEIETGEDLNPLLYFRGRYCGVRDLAIEVGEADPRLGWS